jgi:hypothetical protein
MTFEEARNISIVGYLASQGIEPESHSNGSAWYCSPIRPGEKKPSFKVNMNLNKWKDFGDGKSGDLIDLVCLMNGVSITGALQLLSSPELNKQSLSFRGELSGQPVNDMDENRLTVKHVQPLLNQALIQYVESRGISPALAARYCKEVYYTFGKSENGEVKYFFSVGFENDRHGWELRNKLFKNSCSPKNMTTIQVENKSSVNVFEGFFNFLSALTYYKATKPNCTTIVLNGLCNLHQFIDWLRNSPAQKINLFLDNDPSGEKAVNKIKETFTRVNDYSKIIYPDFNDFNDFLCGRKSKQ